MLARPKSYYIYLLGILINPENNEQVLPVILTGPKESADYFRVLDAFIMNTSGDKARQHYSIIIDDPVAAARQMKEAMPLVKENRPNTGHAYSFNWSLRIAPDLQLPFELTHENMAHFNLSQNQPVEQLTAALRRAFFGILAGNVKERGIQAIEQFGPYKLHGEPQVMQYMDSLFKAYHPAPDETTGQCLCALL